MTCMSVKGSDIKVGSLINLSFVLHHGLFLNVQKCKFLAADISGLFLDKRSRAFGCLRWQKKTEDSWEWQTTTVVTYPEPLTTSRYLAHSCLGVKASNRERSSTSNSHPAVWDHGTGMEFSQEEALLASFVNVSDIAVGTFFYKKVNISWQPSGFFL